MASLNWVALKKAIVDTIKTNSNQEITADVLQGTLMSMIQSLGENATFAGIATPNVNLGLPGGPIFYLAAAAGTYSNGLILGTGEIAALIYSNGEWRKEILTNALQALDITALFTAGGSVSGVTAQKLLTAPLYVKSYTFNSSVSVSVTDQKWFFSVEIIRQTTSGDITRVKRVAVANLNNGIITSESVKDI